jgi:penicillin-binding protein 2
MDDERRAPAQGISRTPKKTPVSVMEDMSWEEFSPSTVREPELPGVTADMGEVRVYPFGGAFAHVIGYVAKVSERDLARPRTTRPRTRQLLHNPGFRIGKQGVEKALDRDLRGRAGAVKAEVDAQGRTVRLDPEGDIPGTPGKEVRLTLDADIQNRALEVMGEESGAIVVMDCRSGDLLCMASAPSFDANRFVKGLSGAEYRALAEYERKPLLDKALSGTFPPGSTFKTDRRPGGAGGGRRPEMHRHVCNGGPGTTAAAAGAAGRRAARPADHARRHQELLRRLFLPVRPAHRAGPDRHRRAGPWASARPSTSASPASKGLVPDREWKKKAYKRPRKKDLVWHPGETPSWASARATLLVNPCSWR